MGRVELDVGAAEPGQLGDLVAGERRHVLEELVERGVGLARVLGRPQVRVQAGAGQGDLGDGARPSAQVGEVLGRDVPAPAQPLADTDAGRPLGGAVADLVAVPVTPQVRLERDARRTRRPRRGGRSGTTAAASRRRSRRRCRRPPGAARRHRPRGPRPASARPRWPRRDRTGRGRQAAPAAAEGCRPHPFGR